MTMVMKYEGNGLWIDEWRLKIPMPMTASVSFEAKADYIRNLPIRSAIQMMVVDPPLNEVYEGMDEHGAFVVKLDTKVTTEVRVKKILLNRKSYAAPAPFVGDPLFETAMYFWDAYVEMETRRYVAMPARIGFRTLSHIDWDAVHKRDGEL